MGRVTTANGDVYYTIPNCDCGSTGGCEKCQPKHIPKHRNLAYIFPEPHEERFMDENLKRFYEKKGLLYQEEM